MAVRKMDDDWSDSEQVEEQTIAEYMCQVLMRLQFSSNSELPQEIR